VQTELKTDTLLKSYSNSKENVSLFCSRVSLMSDSKRRLHVGLKWKETGKAYSVVSTLHQHTFAENGNSRGSGVGQITRSARRRRVAHSAHSTTNCAISASIAIVQSQSFECVHGVRCMCVRVYKIECLCLYCDI
jgi:hypothetical protein